ncbi:uncharacterized protein [Dermacentor albipictus]|uniref:uncharacterized protein isoform X3 n=1 Tax=Dermacentor albipictus TaxID=60249 RepID=UPI0038FCD5A2
MMKPECRKEHVGETSEISQEHDSPTQPDSERLLRNPYEGGPLRSPVITSSSGNQAHTNNVAGAGNQNVHEQTSQVTQPSYEDSTDLPAANAAAMAAVLPSVILETLRRAWPLLNILINTHEPPQAPPSGTPGQAEGEGLSTAGSSQPLSPVAMFNESSEMTYATLSARIIHGVYCQRSAFHQPSSDPPANTFQNGTHSADRSRERNVSGASEAPDDGALSSQQATHDDDDARDTTANIRTRIAGPSLERLVGAHTRRMTLGQQNEASIRVRVLPDLKVLEQGPCHITLMLANEEAGAAEGTHHLAEWETFTRALLTVHVCIETLVVRISAVSRSPGHFYRRFNLRYGTAVIDVEVSAFPDPSIDFVLPYLRRLCRLRMAEQAGTCFQNIVLVNRDARRQEMLRELLQTDARLGLDIKNSNLARILDTTTEMPFLRELVIDLKNTATGPCEPLQIFLNLTSHISTDVRRLRYEVDATYAHFLCCQCAYYRGVSTTTGVETSIIPTLCARRELTCSTGDLVPYIVSVTHPAMHGTYVFQVLSIVRMRDEDQRQ